MGIMENFRARITFSEASAILKAENCDYLLFTKEDPSRIKDSVNILIEKIESLIGNEKRGYRPARRIIIHIDDEVVFAADKIEGVSFEVIKLNPGEWQNVIHSKFLSI